MTGDDFDSYGDYVRRRLNHLREQDAAQPEWLPLLIVAMLLLMPFVVIYFGG